ncbi:transposase [Weeksellaceae bacterium TAE3-ERU29]|nr:transposase [Weeksellaceae bacterium TAE3-ERU29]
MYYPIGNIKRKQRVTDVEPVFAHIKSNRNFKRFTHQGIEKAELDLDCMLLLIT